LITRDSRFLRIACRCGMVVLLRTGGPVRSRTSGRIARPFSRFTRQGRHVPLEQARRLDAGMKKVGARHTLIIKKGAGHGSFHNEKEVWDFLDRNLRAPWWKRPWRLFTFHGDRS